MAVILYKDRVSGEFKEVSASGTGSGVKIDDSAPASHKTYSSQKIEDIATRFDEEIESLNEDLAKQRNEKPLVYIDGTIPKTKDNVLATMTVKSNWLNFFAYIKIKCQGTSSMAHPKKNFTVTLYEDEERTIPLNITIPGWRHPSNKFVLKANYIDRTHARNVINARLWGEIVASRPDYDSLPEELRNSPNNGAVDGFPILVTTNGSYQGVYTWNIGKDAWMWNMDEDNLNHALMCAETNTDGEYAETPCNFRALWSGVHEEDWSVEVGTNSDTLKNSLNALISCVKDTTDEEFIAQIDTHLDVQSAIDYYIFAFTDCGIDGLAKNMLLGTYDMTLWRCGAYDLDTTWGLYWYGSPTVPANRVCPDEYQEQFSLLWERITTLYADRLKERYWELRSTVLSYANIVSHFERFVDEIGEKAYADDVIPYPNIPGKDDNNIWLLRNFARDRLAYCDSEMSEKKVTYELDEPMTFTGTEYIDTGVKLFDEDKNFTIMTEFAPAEGATQSVKLMFCGFDNYELSAADYRPLSMSRMIGGNDKYYAVYAYGVGESCYINPDVAMKHRLVLTHTAGTNKLRGDYTDDNGDAKSFEITAPSWNAFDRSLLVGCHEWQSETKGYFWLGTIFDFRILDYAMSRSDVNAYLAAID